MSRWPLRYAPWMARDLAMGPGLIYLAVALLAAWIVSQTGVTFSGGPGMGGTLLAKIVGQASLPFVLVATGGIVRTDLSEGYYRTLFSKPVSPVAYYLQRWLLGGVAVLVAVGLLVLAVAAGQRTAPVMDWPLLGRMALFYLLLVGLVFLISTLIRRDWIIALLIYILESVLHQISTVGVHFSPFWRGLVAVLPPFHLVTEGAAAPAGRALLHVLVYGLAMVGLALVVLHRRALGSGGRA